MTDETLNRIRTAINAEIAELHCNMGRHSKEVQINAIMIVEGLRRALRIIDEILKDGEQSTLYGYDLKNLIVFADAVRKKEIAESEIEDFVRNASAAWEYAQEEFQRTQKEALDSIMGDHHD